MGKFNYVYSIVSMVFVGGFFVDKGGYNVFEFVVFFVFIFMGLNIYNNFVICEYLNIWGVLYICEGVDDIVVYCGVWLVDEVLCFKVG